MEDLNSILRNIERNGQYKKSNALRNAIIGISALAIMGYGISKFVSNDDGVSSSNSKSTVVGEMVPTKDVSQQKLGVKGNESYSTLELTLEEKALDLNNIENEFERAKSVYNLVTNNTEYISLSDNLGFQKASYFKDVLKTSGLDSRYVLVKNVVDDEEIETISIAIKTDNELTYFDPLNNKFDVSYENVNIISDSQALEMHLGR